MESQEYNSQSSHSKDQKQRKSKKRDSNLNSLKKSTGRDHFINPYKYTNLNYKKRNIRPRNLKSEDLVKKDYKKKIKQLTNSISELKKITDKKSKKPNLKVKNTNETFSSGNNINININISNEKKKLKKDSWREKMSISKQSNRSTDHHCQKTDSSRLQYHRDKIKNHEVVNPYKSKQSSIRAISKISKNLQNSIFKFKK